MPTEHDFNRRPISNEPDFEKPDQDNDFDEIYSQYTTPVLSHSESFSNLNYPVNPNRGPNRGTTRMGTGAGGGRERGWNQAPAATGMSKKKRRNIIAGVIVGIVVVCAVAIPAGIVVAHNKSTAAEASASVGAGGAGPSTATGTKTKTNSAVPTSTQPAVAVSGTDGSTVTTDLGATFTYTNKFGGSYAFDPEHPFDGSQGRGGQCQDYIPRIGEEWVWGRDRIHGVNLGGKCAFDIKSLH